MFNTGDLILLEEKFLYRCCVFPSGTCRKGSDYAANTAVFLCRSPVPGYYMFCFMGLLVEIASANFVSSYCRFLWKTLEQGENT